jgi:hypothetical protein
LSTVEGRCNITDHTDTQDAGRKAEEFLARQHEVVAQTSIKTDNEKLKGEG